MTAVLRSEWIKLRTVRVHWVLIIIAVAFPLVVTTLVAALGELSSSSDTASLVTGLTVVSVMLLGAMSVVSITSDFGHNVIRPTYAATPARRRVHAGKLILNSVVAGLVVALVVAVCWGVASLIGSARDRPISLGDDGVLPAILSVIALGVIVSWFAYALGLVIRNSPATVTIFLLWPLLIENLIGVAFFATSSDGAAKWLPYSAGITATVVDEGSGDDVLGRPWGLVYFGAVALALVVVGLLTDDRRDA